MARMESEQDHPPRSIDSEKMLRFSEWWFAQDNKEEIREQNPQNDDASEQRSAA